MYVTMGYNADSYIVRNGGVTAGHKGHHTTLRVASWKSCGSACKSCDNRDQDNISNYY